MANGENPVVRARAFVRDNWSRARRRLAADQEMQNLKELEAAYGGADGPEVLLFGDSAMFWVSRLDRDRRHLVDMVRDDLGKGVRVHPVIGRGYSARSVMTFMAFLSKCKSKPKVVVVPATVLCVMDIWLAHPEIGHARQTKAMMELLRSGGSRPKRLPPPPPEEIEAYDRMQAPSLLGVDRTVGEIRLVINSVPGSTWQNIVRQRTLYDYYTSEKLTPEGEGPRLMEAMGTLLTRSGYPSVAYLHPIDIDMTVRLLGEGARQHVADNVTVVADAYRRGAGDLGLLVDAAYDCESDQYTDPVHLNDKGRTILAKRIATGVQEVLARPST